MPNESWPTPLAVADRHPRGSSWCDVVRRGENGDPSWCWCRHEVVDGIGQCPDCQEDAHD